MTKKRGPKKPKIVWVGSTAITPITDKESREIDKRIRKRREELRQRSRSPRQGRRLHQPFHPEPDALLQCGVQGQDKLLPALRRIRRGLYDMPKVSPTLGGKLSPDIDEAAQAMSRRQRWKIVPEGTRAANLLGLSTQVPAKIIYLTDGPNNEVLIGRRSIHFKDARPKAMAGLEGKFALVVLALRHLGKEGIGPSARGVKLSTLPC